MKLNDCKSVDLTPVNYADRLGWACAAFDEFVHTLDARRFALAAPFAMTAIQALTDEELQVYYREIGLAPYYADLPRTARENMLFAELANLRKLGTVAAVEALCQYIFGNTPISLEITDNLAFDASGNLTNASLLNLYDVIVTIDNPVLDQFQLSRIFNNVTRFGRVSQKLRGIVMRYETTTVSAYTGVGSLDSAMFYDNGWVNCTVPPTPPVIGVDTTVPNGTTALISKYFWVYGFTQGTTLSNIWSPTNYPSGMLPSDTGLQAVPGSAFAEALIWTGGMVLDCEQQGFEFRLATYNGAPEFYTDDSTAQNASDCAIACRFGANPPLAETQFELPSDFYSISGTTVTWNTSHILYNLLYGKPTSGFVIQNVI